MAEPCFCAKLINMCRKVIKTYLTDSDNLTGKLFFVFCQKTKYFLVRLNKINYKYYAIPSFLDFQKLKKKIFFETNKEASFHINSYVISLNLWLKSFDKKNKKKLILKGLGFRCFLSDDKSAINFKIGFSHIVLLIIPKKISAVSIDKNSLTLESDDKSVLGDFSKRIKQLKTIDVYKNKGFSYKDEVLRLKQIKKN